MAPARTTRSKAKAPATPKRDPKLAALGDKEPTDYHRWFATFIVREIGYNPKEADSPSAAFLAGIRLALTARTSFMESDFLEAKREEFGIKKRGPKAKGQDVDEDEEEETSVRSRKAPAKKAAPASKRRSSKAQEEEDEFEEETEEDEDEEFEEEDSDEEFDDDEEEEDEDEEFEEEEEDDDFEDEETEEEPSPPARSRRSTARTAGSPAKKAVAKKATPVKRASAKKAAAPARKTATKKAAPAKKAAPTARRAKADNDEFLF